MPASINIGSHRVPLDQIAWVEPFEPELPASLKVYQSRVVLLNHDCRLSWDAPEDFVTRDGFTFLLEDQTAFSRTVAWSAKALDTALTYGRPFKTKLQWHDAEGRLQGKLLYAPLEVVTANVVRLGAGAEGGAERWRLLSRREIMKLQNSSS